MRDLALLGRGDGTGRSIRMIQETPDSPVFASIEPSPKECQAIARATKPGELPYNAAPFVRFDTWEEARRLLTIYLNGGSWDAELNAPADSDDAYRAFSRLARMQEAPRTVDEIWEAHDA